MGSSDIHAEIADLQERLEAGDESVLRRLDELYADKNERTHDAATTMFTVSLEALLTSGSAFTCTEYDSIVELARSLGEDGTVAALLGDEASHIREDIADGDPHGE